MATSTTFARSYSWAICLSLVIQAACLVLSSRHFQMFTPRMFFLAFCLYWFGFLAVVLTKPEAPSWWRLLYVGAGFLVWFIAAVLFVPMIYGS